MSVLNKQTILNAITSALPDNTSGLITPLVMRGLLLNVVESMVTLLDGSSIFQYLPSVTYIEGDIVKYNNDIFIKTTNAPMGTTPIDGADWSLLPSSNNFATEENFGLMRIATTLETTTGTDDTVVISPLKLAQRLSDFILSSEKGAINGVATLDANQKVPQSQLPEISITNVYVVADIPARDALTVQTGDVAKVTSENSTYIYDGVAWIEIQSVVNADDIDDSTTTNKFVEQTDLDKLNNITITQVVDLDVLELNSHQILTLNSGLTTQESFTLIGQNLQANEATQSTAGVMPASDKEKLDFLSVTQIIDLDVLNGNMHNNFNLSGDTITNEVFFLDDQTLKVNLATPTTAGVMSALDKDKLDDLNFETEFSYRFIQNETIFEDLFINSLEITQITKTVGIDTVEISINGAAYFYIIPALPQTIPANAEILLRITYNMGYNNGVVVFKGIKL